MLTLRRPSAGPSLSHAAFGVRARRKFTLANSLVMPGYFDANVRVSGESEIMKSPPRNYLDGAIDPGRAFPSFETPSCGSALCETESFNDHIRPKIRRKKNNSVSVFLRYCDTRHDRVIHISTLSQIETFRGIFQRGIFRPCPCNPFSLLKNTII